MMSLGTLLVKHGWITKQQLGLAISRQREIGGRLGTCLLEMGAVSEDLLNRSLAEQQGVPTAAAEDLAAIEDKVSRLLPAPIAIRYRAVPFRATHGDVDIAMLEVDNLWLQDELSFIVGRRLSVYIATEVRVVEALSRYYKAPCSERFVTLLTTLNRELRQRQDGEFHPQSRLVHAKPETEPVVVPIAAQSSPALRLSMIHHRSPCQSRSTCSRQVDQESPSRCRLRSSSRWAPNPLAIRAPRAPFCQGISTIAMSTTANGR